MSVVKRVQKLTRSYGKIANTSKNSSRGRNNRRTIARANKKSSLLGMVNRAILRGSIRRK